MKDQNKSKEQLIEELSSAREEISSLKQKGDNKGFEATATSPEKTIGKDPDRLNQILASLDTGLSLINRDMTIAWVNKTITTIFPHGTPEHTVCHQFFANQQEPCEDCPTLKTFESSESHYTERYSPQDDRWFAIYSQPVLDSSGQVTQVLEGITDITDKKRSEGALIESENKWRHIVSNAPQIGVSLDPSGRILFANDHLLELTGWRRKEVLGRDWFETFVPESDRGLIRKVFDSAMHQEHDHGYSNYENDIIDRSGERLTVAWANVLTLDKEGYPTDVTCMGIDVTERNRAAKALAESEERLTLAVEGTGIGLWDWRVDTGETFFNEKWAEIAGYALAELEPTSIKTWASLCHPEDLELSNSLLQEHFAGKSEFYECELRMKHKLGHSIWVLDRGKVFERDEAGNPLRMAGTHQDISDRKGAEQALKESEIRFKHLHDASFGGIVIHDNGFILDCNQSLCDITGYTVDELIGMDYLLLIAEESQKTVRGNALEGYEKPYEALGMRKNGEKYPLLLAAKDIPYYGRQVRVAEFRDITGQKRAEKEQAVLKTRLKAHWQISRMLEASYQELCDLALHEIQDLTNSQYSFFGFIDENETVMEIHSWSRDAMAECKVGDKPLHFPINKAGVWARPVSEGRAIILNDYEGTAQKRGLPEGHVPIRRLASVPIIQHGKVVALAAVANKADKYTEEDVTQIHAFVSTILLLLDKRKIENQLTTSEERLALALDTIYEGVWDWRIDTHEVYYNSIWYTMLGYEPYELPQDFDTWRLLVHPEDLPDAEAVISWSIANAAPFDMEFRMQAKQGDWRLINSRGRVVEQNSSGQSMRMLGTHMDVTERRRAEEDLRANEAELSSIFRAAPVGIGIVKNRVFTKLNDFFCDMIGYSREELIGQEARTVYPSQAEYEWVGREKYRQIKNQGTGTVETKMQRKDGAVLDVILSSTPMDVSDLSKGVTFTATEITELKRAQEKAEVANKSKSEFLANMSHEIRTPLNGILGMLQLLETTEQDEEQEKYTEIATQSSKRLTRLLSDILDLSRVEAGKLEISLKPFDFKDVMEAVVQLFSPLAREKELDLQIHINSEIPTKLRGDGARLQQVLSNIVGNAIKFTMKGGIKIDAHPLPPHVPDEQRVLFSIEDTGIGINDETLRRLFTPFTQAEGSYKRQFQGAGLGLSISKRLVSMMGGTMAVESEEGVGSTFHFCVPFKVAARAGGEADINSKESYSRHLRILVAEDDRTSSMVVVKHLEKFGHRVVAVSDGEQVIAMLRENPFDLVLMDVQMPNLDGVETTKAIRRGDAGNNKEIPIIAMTAYAMTDDKDTFLKAGMDGYVSKPVDKQAMLDAIAKAITKAND